MKRQRKVTLLAVFLILVLALSACGKTTASQSKTTENKTNKQVVTIGYLPITHALSIFEEKKLLENENSNITIKLQKFSSWSDLTDALNAGRIDGASVLMELAMSAVSQGVDLKAVALGHKDGNVIIAGRDIQSVKDLKGKTFAIPHTQSSHNILLNDMLAKGGLTTKDVKVVQMAPSEMPSSLANGSIAGYCVAEPFGAQAVNQKIGHVLYDSEDLWTNSLCCGLVFTGKFIKSNKATVKTMTTKYEEAGKKLDDKEATSIATQYLGQSESVLKLSLKWIKFNDLKITKKDYNALVSKLKKYKINENPPAYDKFVYQP
ncbi:MAG: ABC transporter substrate-binding protein [Anaerostipes sp.]|nr:ABC transporter substrate-binding protein [Anaerostipes sp.]